MVKNLRATTWPCYVQIRVIMRCVVKGQFYKGIIGK